jgi:hypothetical protein
VAGGPGPRHSTGSGHVYQGRFKSFSVRDDEYHPDYLAEVTRRQDEAEVLVFNYDMVIRHDDGREQVVPNDPARSKGELFARNIANPIPVAHWRSWMEQYGGFEEIHWLLDDWTVWRRFAGNGVEFLFVPHRSRPYSRSLPARANGMAHPL